MRKKNIMNIKHIRRLSKNQRKVTNLIMIVNQMKLFLEIMILVNHLTQQLLFSLLFLKLLQYLRINIHFIENKSNKIK